MAYREVAGWLVALAAAAWIAPASPALAQADYVEGFDNNGEVPDGKFGPADLIAKGWIFRSQCSPNSAQAFFDGYEGFGWPTPQAGPGYLAADAFMPFDGPISNWAILPAIPNQQAGDVITVHLQRLGALPVRIEVRYSPSGGIGTGTGPTDVGDFTQVLVSASPVPTGAWKAYDAPVPGSGRLAIRLAGQYVSFSGGAYTGIDTLSVGEAPEPPCNLPPSPDAGETVTWTLADSPYQVCSDVLIPAGGKVIVEPGVIVNVDPGHTLVIDGEVKAHGTAQKRITLNGTNSYVPAPFHVEHGTLDLRFGTVSGRIHGGVNTTLLLADTNFTGLGTVSTSGFTIYDDDQTKFVRLDRCSFQAGGMLVEDATLAVFDTTFTGSNLSLLRGYLFADNVELSGGTLDVIREWPAQPLLIDNIRAAGNGGGPGLRFDGGNYLLGPGNTLSGNLYPVELKGGLLPGTVLPQSGNTNNFIRVPLNSETPRGRLYWADLSLPYVVDGVPLNGTAGELTIEPGTTVKFKPGSAWSFMGGQRLVAEGLPGAPITFEWFGPGQKWGQISFNSNGNMPRIDNCIVRGSNTGIVASDTPNLTIQNSLLEKNATAAAGVVFGHIIARKSRFFDNDTGVFTDSYPVSHGSADLYGRTNPNWFEGNGLAVEITNGSATTPAEFNYWGHPSGPQHPQNPGGQGDPIGGIGASGVQIFPFLDSPPDFQDHPPVVRMKEVYPLHETGDTIIFEWDAFDDGQILEQRVLFTPHGNNPAFEVIDELPPGQRRYEFTIPVIEPSSNNNAPFIRILAVDDAGQEAFDEAAFDVPYLLDWSGTLTPTTDFGEVFTPGEVVDICWQKGEGASGTIDAYVFLDGDETTIPLGGAHTGVDCLSLGLNVPDASTDTARIGLRLNYGAGGRSRWFFGEEFTIRPDPRVGDAPPEVAITSPDPGQQFAGGAAIQVAWEAGDDHPLRAFRIQASTNAGRSWQTVGEVGGDQSTFAWLLPPSKGIPDVRVRVIAIDARFQNTSDTVKVAVLPGDGCPPDLDGNGLLDLFDFLEFVNLFNAGDPLADFDQSGSFDLFDFLAFANAFNEGC